MLCPFLMITTDEQWHMNNELVQNYTNPSSKKGSGLIAMNGQAPKIKGWKLRPK